MRKITLEELKLKAMMDEIHNTPYKKQRYLIRFGNYFIYFGRVTDYDHLRVLARKECATNKRPYKSNG